MIDPILLDRCQHETIEAEATKLLMKSLEKRGLQATTEHEKLTRFLSDEVANKRVLKLEPNAVPTLVIVHLSQWTSPERDNPTR